MRYRLLLCGWMALALVACGGGGDGDGNGGADGAAGQDVAAGDGLTEDGAATGADGGDATAPPERLAIDLVGLDPETTVFTEARLAVRTRVYDPDAVVPVGGVAVSYALAVVQEPPAGSADGALEETEALTDGDGHAVVVFATGTAAGAVYRITASAEGAEAPVTLTVTTQSQATGGIRVTFTYEGDEAPPETVRVLLFAELYQCDAFNPGAPPDAPLDQEVAFAAGALTVADLQQSPNWNVLIVGLDAAGSVVAGGCAQQVRVVADVTTTVPVTLRPVGLHLPGTYALSETLDVSAAAPADAAALVTAFEAALADPRGALTTALGAAISDQLAVSDPEGECDGLWTAALPAAVEAGVPAAAPWAGALADLPARLAPALVAVTLEAELTITGAAPGPYTGAIAWRALSLSFDGAAVRWEPSDLAATLYPIRLADDTTTWSARVDGYDDLVVTEHDLVLEPGRIAAALVLEAALADVPGAPAKLADLALGFFDCAAVVAALPGEVTTCLSEDGELSTEDVRAACETAVTEHVAAATDLLEGWVTPSVVLSLAGTGTVVDADQDLGVDRVDDGALDGALTADAAPAGAVTGTFTLAR